MISVTWSGCVRRTRARRAPHEPRTEPSIDAQVFASAPCRRQMLRRVVDRSVSGGSRGVSAQPLVERPSGSAGSGNSATPVSSRCLDRREGRPPVSRADYRTSPSTRDCRRRQRACRGRTARWPDIDLSHRSHSACAPETSHMGEVIMPPRRCEARLVAGRLRRLVGF